MKKIIIGVTAAIMLAGASVYAANTITTKSEKQECTKDSCCCPLCDDCCGSTCCSK